ncbi:hypothetical protein Fmac_031959 [Flemingia macrophylla]|uniref:Polygalacturonase n=1 Tax=Flemingia macrophylla TaxID=520843 RepID=A0ABD1L3Z7_9FABA
MKGILSMLLCGIMKPIRIQCILGTLLAPTRNAWRTCSRRWLHILDVHGLTFDGSGVINGQGQDWWANALLFERCDDLLISGLTHINGPGSHIYVVHSQNTTISNVKIYSPAGISHNTDGIDLTNSVGVNILDSVMSTEEHLLEIIKFLESLLSVGSIGEGRQTEFVEHVIVSNCIFNGADSAARIKTWPKDAVKVSNVTFSNIYGTCISENAVVLDCAKIGCDNITLNQINITSIDPSKPASAVCNNVHGKTTNIVSPSALLFERCDDLQISGLTHINGPRSYIYCS